MLPDLSVRELAMLVPLAMLAFGIGLYPQPLVDLAEHGIASIASTAR